MFRRRERLARDLRREFSAVMAEAEAKSATGAAVTGSALGSLDEELSISAVSAGAKGAAGAGGADGGAGGAQLQSVLPLLSLTTTALSFSTLTRVLFRIAFRYK